MTIWPSVGWWWRHICRRRRRWNNGRRSGLVLRDDRGGCRRWGRGVRRGTSSRSRRHRRRPMRRRGRPLRRRQRTRRRKSCEGGRIDHWRYCRLLLLSSRRGWRWGHPCPVPVCWSGHAHRRWGHTWRQHSRCSCHYGRSGGRGRRRCHHRFCLR